MFVLNSVVCLGTNQTVDGTLFATLCNTVGVLFVYRFWDSITEGIFKFFGWLDWFPHSWDMLFVRLL